MTIQDNYLKRARFWSQILKHCPGVRAIFLSGSLTQGRASKKSDIDFFIITQHGKIWTARFFVFIVLKLFRRIATESDHAGNICPNHFISDLDLEIREKDKYSAHLFAHNKPLYDADKYWINFMNVNKNWIQEHGYSFSRTTEPGLQDSSQSNTNSFGKDQSSVNEIKTGLGGKNKKKCNLFEQIFKKIQLKKIKSNPDYNLPGAMIILKDHELRFHPKPKNKHILRIRN